MHELSICNALIEQVERIARERQASSVTRIALRLGPLSGIEIPLLRNAWPLAATGTVAEDAELAIAASDVVVRCSQCGHESSVPVNRLLCGSCGDFRTRIIQGDEMILESVELSRPQSVSPGAAEMRRDSQHQRRRHC